MNKKQVKRMREQLKQISEDDKERLEKGIGNLERKLELYEEARLGGIAEYFLKFDLYFSPLEPSRKIPLEFHQKMLEADQKIAEASGILEKKSEEHIKEKYEVNEDGRE